MTDFEKSRYCSKQNALKIIGCNSHSIYLRDKSYDLECKDCKYNPMKGKVLIDKADLEFLIDHFDLDNWEAEGCKAVIHKFKKIKIKYGDL